MWYFFSDENRVYHTGQASGDEDPKPICGQSINKYEFDSWTNSYSLGSFFTIEGMLCEKCSDFVRAHEVVET
jgi:hypothetical protein